MWYRLTPAGADLGPVVDALGRWGLRHAWRMPRAGEPLHGEHLLRAAVQAFEMAADDHRPARWHVRLDGTDYRVESDGRHWSVATGTPPAPVDVTVTGTTDALATLIFGGPGDDVTVTGAPAPVHRFRRLVGAMAAVVEPDRPAASEPEPG